MTTSRHPSRALGLPLIVTGFLLTFAPATRAEFPADPYEKRGPHPVANRLFDWTDPARDNRAVPVKIFHPSDINTPQPVIVFSHGLGGSREGYSYLGEHWASHGYLVVHVQHPGSDDAVWKGKPPRERMQALREAVTVIDNAINRPRDVSFVLDQLTTLNTNPQSPLHGRIDMSRVGVGGHSFGAFTVLAISGQSPGNSGRFKSNLADPRIKAAIAMSPQPPSRPMNDAQLDKVYSTIRIPILHMTGTLDNSPINADLQPEQRTLPYRHTHGAPASLLVFQGGDHMVFSGRERGQASALFNRAMGDKDPEMHAAILMSSTAFWHAHLKSDAAAARFLRDGDFQKVLGDLGTWQTKQPKP